jgi:hypothetical protein
MEICNKIDLKEVRFENMDWIRLAEDRLYRSSMPVTFPGTNMHVLADRAQLAQ